MAEKKQLSLDADLVEAARANRMTWDEAFKLAEIRKGIGAQQRQRDRLVEKAKEADEALKAAKVKALELEAKVVEVQDGSTE